MAYPFPNPNKQNNSSRLIELIREEFQTLIERKTGWGKNEIMNTYDQAVAAATLKFIDELSI